jgi:predicted alpha/beta hydrolase family esterase
MTRQLLFVQGGGEGAHDDWDDKLVASLERALGPDYAVRYPRMPNEADPKFAAWSAALRAEIDALEDGAILVGHSVGAAVLVHTLAEAPGRRTPAGIFLIAAPFIGDGGWPSDEIAPKPDLGARLPAQSAVFLYQGDADDTVPLAHADHYARAIPQTVVRRLQGRDHQLNNDLSAVATDILALAQRSNSKT